MHPHKGVAHPPRGGALQAVAFLVRQGGLVILKHGAKAVLYGRREEPPPRQHHQEGHHTLGLFEKERRPKIVGL